MSLGITTKLSFILLLFACPALDLAGQQGLARLPARDCAGALPLCRDTILRISGGSGLDDFDMPGNDAGCLTFGERNSTWFYVQFRDDLPPGTFLELMIEPAGASLADYNLAVFGPHRRCDSLGTAIRCTNFSSPGSTTGLRAGENDFFEDASNGDGFLAPLTPVGGEGYYVLVDYLNNFGVEGNISIRLSGPAASFLQCDAIPGCSGFRLFYPGELQFCTIGDSVRVTPLPGSAIHWESIAWSGSGAGVTFLTNPERLDPVISASLPFSDTVRLRITASNGSCREDAVVRIKYAAFEREVIRGDTLACEGAGILLNAADSMAAYFWSTGETARSIEVDSPGIYAVTLTDRSGCRRSDSLSLNFRVRPDSGITADTSICRGETALLEARSPGLSYEWSDRSTGRTRLVTEEGLYALTVTDDLGCRAQDSVFVRSSRLVPPVISGPELFCKGTEALLHVREEYDYYSWSTGADTPVIRVELPGEYRLLVGDELGCYDTTVIVIDWFEMESLVLPEDLGFCRGSQLVAGPGAGYESYLWSDGTTNPEIVIMQPGDYSLLVKDTNGCRQDTSFRVEILPTPEFFISGRNYLCAGDSIVLEAIGQAANWAWTDGAVGPERTVTRPGEYQLIGQNENGCELRQSLVVREEKLPVPVIAGPEQLCAGDSIQIGVSDTFSVYTWTDGPASPERWVASAGSYRVAVENELGCRGAAMVTIEEMPLPEIRITGPVQYCDSEQIVLEASPGLENYRWSTGAEGPAVVVSSPGRFQVTASSLSGCSAAATHEVRQLPRPVISISGPMHLCTGDTISLEATPGLAGYRWSNGSRVRQTTIWSGGEYYLTGIADNGCSDTIHWDIAEIRPPEFSVSGARFLCAGSSQVLSTEPAFEQVLWPDGTMADEWISGETGVIYATVTDNFGCSNTEALEVMSISSPEIIVSDTASINCREETVRLLPEFSLPEDLLEYNWSGPGIDGQNKALPRPLINQPGEYILNVRETRYGCAAEPVSIFVLDLSAPPELSLEFSGVLDCRTDSVVLDGSNSAQGVGIAYRWLDEEGELLDANGTPVRTFFEEGQYYFEVADTVRNCISRQEVFLDGDYTIPLVDAGPDTALYCVPNSIRLDGSNSFGHRDLAYRWYSSGGIKMHDSTAVKPLVDTPGHYFLEIRDLTNGCIGRDSVFVSDRRDPLPVALADTFFLGCRPYQAVLHTGLEGTTNYLFEWYAEDSTLVGLDTALVAQKPGAYRLLVTDRVTGCEAEEITYVREGEEIPGQYEMEIRPPTCGERADGQVEFRDISGGTGPYLIDFAGTGLIADQRFRGLKKGIYEFSIRDVYGCEHHSQLLLENRYELELDLGERLEVRLGEVVVLEPRINTPLDSLTQLQWKSGGAVKCEFCPEITLLPTQNQLWQAGIVDMNGCTANDQVSIVVTKPYEIYLPSAFSPGQDGQNDDFSIYISPDLVRINFFRIFDRWGNLVHAKAGMEVQGLEQLSLWGSTEVSSQHPAAVYVYQMEVEFIDGVVRQFSGDFLLFR